MKIICQNCGKEQTKKAKAMQDAGFSMWNIACKDCGQNALAESAASLLGKLGAGKPKHFSPEEIARRTERIKSAQKKRARKMT
jgi:hypothetical protein